MKVKLGKEKILCKNENFRVKYGTINSLDLKSVYIIIESWVTPEKNGSNNRLLSKLKKHIRENLNNNMSFFNKNYILDLDLRTSGLKKNKKSFMCLDLTLFNTKSNITFNDDILNSSVTDISYNLMETLKTFNFSYQSNKN